MEVWHQKVAMHITRVGDPPGDHLKICLWGGSHEPPPLGTAGEIKNPMLGTPPGAALGPPVRGSCPSTFGNWSGCLGPTKGWYPPEKADAQTVPPMGSQGTDPPPAATREVWPNKQENRGKAEKAGAGEASTQSGATGGHRQGAGSKGVPECLGGKDRDPPRNMAARVCGPTVST